MSTPWIVHQYRPSPYCERLRRALVAMEIPFVTKDYLPLTDEERAEHYALVEAANHNQMPVLERDGQYVGDSALIIDRLLDEFPERAERVLPADPATRAVVRAFEVAVEGWFLRPEMQHWTPEYQEMKGEHYARIILHNDLERRDLVLGDWNAALASQPFLTGETYNLADMSVAAHMNARITIANWVHDATEQGVPIPFDIELWPRWEVNADTFPHLRAWLDKLNQPEYTESPVPAA